jgi:hypothetical protein
MKTPGRFQLSGVGWRGRVAVEEYGLSRGLGLLNIYQSLARRQGPIDLRESRARPG